MCDDRGLIPMFVAAVWAQMLGSGTRMHARKHDRYQFPEDIREFKQSTTAGATTAAVTEKVWGEYVSVVCQILS